MHNTTLAHLSLAATLLAATGSALAGRPLQTEDAGVLDRAACELEGAGERLSSRDGARLTSQSLGLACGLGLASQAGLQTSQSRAKVPGEETSRERGAAIVGKTRLAGAADGDGPALTLAWGIDFSKSSGDWRRSAAGINAVASIPAGPGTIHLNGGTTAEREPRRNVANWGLAYEHEGFELVGLNWAPMAELFGDDRGGRFGNIALRVTLVPEKLYVDFSYGRQLSANQDRLLTAGFKLAF